MAAIRSMWHSIVPNGKEGSMNEVVVIPTLEPTWRIFSLVRELREAGFRRFIVVDDGSSEQARFVFETLEANGACVLHHGENKGKGAAIKTALAECKVRFPQAPAIVTVDGDGQHVPSDVVRVCASARTSPSALAIGARNLTSPSVPLRSRLGNAFSAAFFKLDTGVACPDTQTGLRRIPVGMFGLAASTPGERYDYEMNFLTAAAKSGAHIEQVPIGTVYINDNAESHFRPVRDSLLIYCQFLRFALCSLFCAVFDLGLFALVAATLPLGIAPLVAAATALARISSGALNFALNRVFSFRAQAGNGTVQAGRYSLLFVAQMLLSMLFVTLLAVLPVPLVAVKVLVDGTLFFASYFVQRNWVFGNGGAGKPADSLRAGARKEVRNGKATFIQMVR